MRARTRVRDFDGQVRRVEATASTRKMAEHRLKEKLTQRAHASGTRQLTADSSFSERVEVWLADLDLEGGLAPSTRAIYERNVRQLIESLDAPLVPPPPLMGPRGVRRSACGCDSSSVGALASSKKCSECPDLRPLLGLCRIDPPSAISTVPFTGPLDLRDTQTYARRLPSMRLVGS